MDCFLYEGPKVLYRVGLSILINFYKHKGSNSNAQYTELITILKFEILPQKLPRLYRVLTEFILRTTIL